MGMNLRTFVHALTLRAGAASKTPAEVARAIVLGQFTSAVENGRTLIRTNEAGGGVEFVIPEGLTPANIIDLGTRALEHIEAQPDPTKPGLPRVTRRLRFTFDRASL